MPAKRRPASPAGAASGSGSRWICGLNRRAVPGHPQFQPFQLPEVRQSLQLGERVRRQEAQPGGRAAVLAGHHQGVAAQAGDSAGVAERPGKHRPQLLGPGGLIGGLVHQALQRRMALAVLGQQQIDLDGDANSLLISEGCMETISRSPAKIAERGTQRKQIDMANRNRWR